jgi:hypothetical protein
LKRDAGAIGILDRDWPVERVERGGFYVVFNKIGKSDIDLRAVYSPAES